MRDVHSDNAFDLVGKQRFEHFGGLHVRQMAPFRRDTSLQVGGIRALLEHADVVVGLEGEYAAPLQRLEGFAGHHARVGHEPHRARSGLIIEAKPERLGGIVRRRERVHAHAADSQVVAACESAQVDGVLDGLKVAARTANGLARVKRRAHPRFGEPARHDTEAFRVVGMLMGHEDSLDARELDAAFPAALQESALAYAAIDDDASARRLVLHDGAVALAAAREHMQPHAFAPIPSRICHGAERPALPFVLCCRT